MVKEFVHQTVCFSLLHNKDMHRQLIARYDAERMALNILPVKPFGGNSYRGTLAQGHDRHLVAYAPRPANLPMTDVTGWGTYFVLTDLETWRDRLNAAIDKGFIYDPIAPLRETELDLNTLGEIAEANYLSRHFPYYGNLHNAGHNIIARLHDPLGELQSVPAPMGDLMSAPGDPVFWEWHKHLDGFGVRFDAAYLARNGRPDYSVYEPDGVRVNDIKLVNSKIKKGNEFIWEDHPTTELFTFMKSTEVELAADSALLGFVIEQGEDQDYSVILKHKTTVLALDNVPFKYQIKVASASASDVWVRIFIAPEARVNDYLKWIEMDKFQYHLSSTTDTEDHIIERISEHSSILQRLAGDTFPKPGDSPDLIESHCRCGLPKNLLLPRGTMGPGMRFVLSVIITKDVETTCPSCPVNSYCGSADPAQKYPDSLPLGYPFHLPFKNRPWLSEINAHQIGISPPSIKETFVTIKYDPTRSFQRV